MRGKSKFKRADCWNYFVTKFCEKTNLYFDHCTIEKNGQLCGSKFVHHGATTRLNKHLIQKHKIKLVIVNKGNDEKSNEDASSANNENPSLASSSSSAIPSLANNQFNKQSMYFGARGLSFGDQLNMGFLNGNLANGYTNPFNFNFNNNNNNINGGHFLNSIQPATNSISSPTETTNFSDSNMLLISFILSSSTSIDLLENKWFKMFIENLNSNYKLPTREELGNLFKNLYNNDKKSDKKSLSSSGGVSE